jgi:DNA mismatch endonuclease, patch repair protein
VKGSGNAATELRLIEIFRAYKIRGWRRRGRLMGKPDFIFPGVRLALFVDGCFWHGCRLHGTIPESNRSFWEKKIRENMTRDRFVRRGLEKLGWRVIRIWQHELRQPDKVAKRVNRALEKSAADNS